MDFDYLFVGGGLQSGLAVQALRLLQPQARVGLCERASALGGNHTWSFHERDVPERLKPSVEPLIVARWTGYDVHFPGLVRHLHEPYATISSERFDAVLRASLDALGCALLLGARALRVTAHEVELEDGRRLTAGVVCDARGPEALEVPPATGFQKFVGLEVRLARPAAFRHPVLMDATVPQVDGYRFLYVLPFADDRLLVEDTYYSDDAGLDGPRLREGILAWIAAQGLEVAQVLREERGVLPLPLGPPRTQHAVEGPIVGGYQGGWFHPTTGYSVPLALRLAELLAAAPPEARVEALQALVRERDRHARYARMLNRLLFGAFPPHQRWNVLERFYRLPESTIRRFYALSLTRADRLRIICGRPPRGLSLATALRSMRARPRAARAALPEVP